MNMGQIQHVHLVGIGGIGVSAVARYMLVHGKHVSGSDLAPSAITDALVSRGAAVIFGEHRKESVAADVDLLVYSPAISKDNPERVEAEHRGIAILSYPEMVGELMEGHVRIVVAGTHGKSTTSAMVGRIFQKAGLDPTVIVGSLVPGFDGNVLVGNGKFFIVEGDEYQASFLRYKPDCLIITNIEADHLDFYKDLDDVKQSFHALAKKVPPEGFIVANIEDRNVLDVCHHLRSRVLWFGKGDTHESEITPLKIPGRHNINNALAACMLACELGVAMDIIASALKEFPGIWRRFEVKGESNGVTIIDDYAHHPTEIRATLKAAKEKYPGRRIWCIFQPHQRNRTRMLFQDFVNSFQDADKLVLTEIFFVEGREAGESINAKNLFDEILKHRDLQYIPQLGSIISGVLPQLKRGDVVITMGAGSITRISGDFLRALSELPRALR